MPILCTHRTKRHCQSYLAVAHSPLPAENTCKLGQIGHVCVCRSWKEQWKVYDLYTTVIKDQNKVTIVMSLCLNSCFIVMVKSFWKSILNILKATVIYAVPLIWINPSIYFIYLFIFSERYFLSVYSINKSFMTVRRCSASFGYLVY